MNLAPWKSSKAAPFFGTNIDDDMAMFQREMNNLMSNFLNRSDFSLPLATSTSFIPSVDLKERDDAYLLDADVPGMSEKDIVIDFHNNILTIKGEKKDEKETKDEGYVCKERSHRSFRRDIAFDENVDQEKIKAELKSGVLHIELAKKEKSKTSHKKIEIKH